MGHFSEATQTIHERRLLTDDFKSLLPLFRLACLSRDFDLVDKYYTELTSSNSPISKDYLKGLLLAARGDTLARKYSNHMYIRLLLAEKENWDLWFDNYELFLEEIPYRCCSDTNLEIIYLDREDPNIDNAFIELMQPIWNHPKFPYLFEKYKKCRDRNAKKFNFDNTILGDLF